MRAQDASKECARPLLASLAGVLIKFPPSPHPLQRRILKYVLSSTRRRKCPVDQPGKACAHCIKRRLSCSLETEKKGYRQDELRNDEICSPQSTYAFDSAPQSLRLPPIDVCIDVGSLYFRYIHDTFHSLFHQASVEEDIANGTLPRVLLLGIIGMASRFSQEPYFEGIEPRSRAQPYVREAQRLLDLRDISVTTIQACVLLGACVVIEGEAASESLYYSIACRLAMLLDLPNLPVDTRLEQETNIRIWWTLNMVDVWSSNGVRLPRSIVPRDDVAYPMDESVYLNMRRSDREPLARTTAEESSQSLLTQMVQLNAVLYEIGELNRSITSGFAGTPTSDYGFDPRVDVLGRKLDNWYFDLPSQLKDTRENIEYYASIGLGHLFVAVYLGYYHFGQLLYYQYLYGDIVCDDEERSNGLVFQAPRYAEKCKAHSTRLCEILYRAYSTPWCEVYYSMIGHVLVVASTVQLFILLFSSSDVEVTAARERLERNFEILTKLQTYWPTVDLAFSRFRAFHKACLDEKQRNESFRMDRWMMKFQFEFAEPITQREMDDPAVFMAM